MVTWLPIVEIDEPAQKRRKVPSRRTDGGRSAGGALSAAAPARPTGPRQLARNRGAAPPSLAAARSTPPASCRHAAQRGANAAASHRGDRDAAHATPPDYGTY